MATSTVRWNLIVSKEIDQSLRELLSKEGRSRESEISRFVEEAVSKHIFDTTLRAVHEANKDVDPDELDAAIEESLAWARAQMR